MRVDKRFFTIEIFSFTEKYFENLYFPQAREKHIFILFFFFFNANFADIHETLHDDDNK